jgi:hypothetical protein
MAHPWHIVGIRLRDQSRKVRPWRGQVAADEVRFSARNDDEVADLRRVRSFTCELHCTVSRRDQMVSHDVLGLRHVLRAHRDTVGSADAPRRGELCVEKHGACQSPSLSTSESASKQPPATFAAFRA